MGTWSEARSKDTARTFLARLKDLERMLAEENTDFLAARLENPNLDAVPKATLLNNRQDLLEEIRFAKEYFEALAQ